MSRKKIAANELILLVSLFMMSSCATHNVSTGLALVPRTGQITSQADGDDGNLQKGVAWPSPRFTDHGNGTVTDNLTGLVWTKNAQQVPGEKTWSDALTACNNLDYAGYQDWRLPNIRELHSLVDYSRDEKALPSNHPFQAVQDMHYWSSTNYEGDITSVWVVFFPNGAVGYTYKNEDSFYVWPVRGGQ